MLTLECITYVDIDTEYIANKCLRGVKHPTDKDIEEYVKWYVQGLDDCEYYAIGYEEERHIIEEVTEIIKEREGK